MKQAVESARVRRRFNRDRDLVRHIEKIQAELAEHRGKLEDTQRRLRLSSRRYHELYHLAPVGFFTLTRDGRISELNEKGAAMLGFAPEWLLGRPFLVFVARNDVSRFLKFLTSSTIDASEKTIEIKLDSGRPMPVKVSLKTFRNGSGNFHRMSVLDLSAVKKSEMKLQRSLQDWHSLIHHAPEIIMLLDRGGKIVFANQPAWGHAVGSLVGTPILDYISPTERPKVRRSMESAFRKRQRVTCEIEGIDGYGQQCWFSLSFGPAQHPSDPYGAPNRTTLMIREISEHKRAEQTLRASGEQMRQFAARLEAVREEERTRVAREIHDELGQALTVLKLDLHWVQDKTPRGQAETRKRMHSMMRQIDQAIQSVRKIAYELRPAVLDDLGLGPAIEWQLREFQAKTGIRTEFRANVEKLDSPGGRDVVVFRVVQEALTNVMRHASATRVRVVLLVEGKTLQVSIADNGKGMPAESAAGTHSVGIVGMKERIAGAGGELIIRSRPGKGTRIEMHIPVETHD